MYGNTEQMAEHIARNLAERGVRPIRMYNLSSADPSVVLRDVFKYDTLVVGSPTYNGDLFPEVEALLRKIEARGIPQRTFAAFGSFTWASAAVKHLREFAEKLKWTMCCEPLEMKQGFDGRYDDACDRLADAVAARWDDCRTGN